MGLAEDDFSKLKTIDWSVQITAREKAILDQAYGQSTAHYEVYNLTQRAARALDGVEDLTRKVTSDDLQALLYTAEAVTAAKIGTAERGGIRAAVSIEPIRIMSNAEGLFEMGITWAEDGRDSARLLQVGFVVNPAGDLLIGKSQRHLLGHLWRKGIKDKYQAEKVLGDKYIELIEHETGISIEMFGVLMVVMVLGNHVPGKNILFYFFENHPQIRQRRNEMGRLTSGDDISRLEQDIEGIRRMVDFQAMLAQIGLSGEIIQTDGLHLMLPISAIKIAIRTNFTDDQLRPNRYKHRRILYQLEQMQTAA